MGGGLGAKRLQGENKHIELAPFETSALIPCESCKYLLLPLQPTAHWIARPAPPSQRACLQRAALVERERHLLKVAANCGLQADVLQPCKGMGTE